MERSPSNSFLMHYEKSKSNYEKRPAYGAMGFSKQLKLKQERESDDFLEVINEDGEDVESVVKELRYRN